jgi:hypothetical protein
VSKRNKSSFRSPRQAAKTALGNRGFIPHTRELMDSEAWRTRPICVVRLIEFLEREHLKHCGKENGYLSATYADLERLGISRRLINRTIEDAVRRGLVRITRRGSYRNQMPSLYQLTYLAWKLGGLTGPEYIEPSNEWRHYHDPPKRSRPARPRDVTGRFAKPNQRLTLVVRND